MISNTFKITFDRLLGTKCDVCVLSEETQVFRLVDAILESNLWPLAEDFEEDLEGESKLLAVIVPQIEKCYLVNLFLPIP